MTANSVLRGNSPAAVVPRDQSHNRDTHPCALQTTCQPPSAWCKDPWPAVIRMIATDGVSLTLARRFEKGAGLAIEIPGDDGSTSTVLARVTAVQPYPEGGWMLDCRFISQLSEEEVRTVLQLDQLAHASAEVANEVGATGPDGTKKPVAIASVLFQARLYSGEVTRWFIKRLDLTGNWPLAQGAVVNLRVGKPDMPPVALVVKKCVPLGECWLVNCKFQTQPSPELLQAINPSR